MLLLCVISHNTAPLRTICHNFTEARPILPVLVFGSMWFIGTMRIISAAAELFVHVMLLLNVYLCCTNVSTGHQSLHRSEDTHLHSTCALLKSRPGHPGNDCFLFFPNIMLLVNCTVLERWSFAGELSLSYAQLAADG